MKKIKLLCFIVYLFTINLYTQSTRIEKNDNIYLTINKNVEYIVKNIEYKDNIIPLTKNHTFNIKRNSIDIYLNWINPLQYKLVLQDSIINDISVEKVKKFFTEDIAGLAGGSSFIAPASVRGSGIINDCTQINGSDIVSQMIPEFYNALSASFAGDKVLCDVWIATSHTMVIDLSTSEKELIKNITDIYKATTVYKATVEIKNAEKILANFAKEQNKIIAKLYDLEQKINKLTSANQSALKTKLTDYSVSQNKIFTNIKRLIELLKLYVIQVKTSLEKESNDFNNHFRVKTITLPKSKSVKLTIKLSERELKDDLTLNDQAVSKTLKLLIQKYDFITPKIGTGIFYSSASLNGFGVTTNNQDELIVTKNDIEKNTAVTGVFLSLNFDIGSQFLEPLIQIGVDPTKEKPYLLLGGGISIPVSNFSISGGPVWTWEAKLSSLNVDDTVISTSVLEEDISYKFQTAPRGFYLGLNYSF